MESIFEYMSEGEAMRYQRMAEPLTREQRARLNFIRTGGRDCVLRKQRKKREERSEDTCNR